jgi:DNA adenine methylase
VILVELDEDVAAVWKTILSSQSNWLVQRIADFEMEMDNLREELAKPVESIRQRAFCTILRNRTLHGGILASGSRFAKYGENGKGIRSCWYANTLARRINDIHDIRDKIVFIHGDGLEVIKEHTSSAATSFFVDPPYTASRKKAGKRLYTYNDLNHDELFDLMTTVKGDFLMTYDDNETVQKMAEDRAFDVALVAMQSRRLNTMYEFLIGRNLAWMEQKGPTQRLLFD